MRTVELTGTDIVTSALGFGCAGLFGLPRRAERRAVLETAFEAGIRHFDVAPMYGLGLAESELAPILKRHREEITVTTKFGIDPTLLGRIAGRTQGPVRAMLGKYPRLGKELKESGQGPGSGLVGRLLYSSGGFDSRIAERSLRQSLQALGTEYVDIFLLHDPTADLIGAPDIVTYLNEQCARGRIRCWGVTGGGVEFSGGAQAMAESALLIQTRQDIFDEPPIRGSDSPKARITFGVIGRALPALQRYLQQFPDERVRWSERLGLDLQDESCLPALASGGTASKWAWTRSLHQHQGRSYPGRRGSGIRRPFDAHPRECGVVGGIRRSGTSNSSRLTSVIEDLGAFADTTVIDGDLAIVGAGPAGIVVALEAAKHGIKVILLESGSQFFDPGVQQLSAAAEWDHNRHAPMTMAVRRQVGGTSVIWGGRCVPYDPVDFDKRPISGSVSWPVTYEEMSGYFQRACDWLVCGRNVFNVSGLTHLPDGMVPGLVDGDVTSSSLERWSLPTNFGKTYATALRNSLHVRLLTGVTCTEVVCPRETSEADHLVARTLAGGEIRVRAKAFVIASGGLEGTRLLMTSEGPKGGQLGNESGHLGRWYMAHLEGVVANVRFSTPPRSTVYGYERDVDGVYVRRRFCFSREFQLHCALPNVAGWIANPELPDARHRSGPLSFVYLALSSRFGPKFAPEAQRLSMTGTEIPGTPYGGATRTSHSSHVRNVLAEPLSTGRFMIEFGAKRFLVRGRRAPGFFIYNKRNVYPFEYHGEHLPNADSRVSLSSDKDELGRQKLNIDLRFSDADVDGIVRAHGYWDDFLRSSGLGSMEYLHPDVHEAVGRRLGGGFHQIGTTRMAASSSDGVVDKNLTVFGTTNVFVASSSTFVTSGQANSTFMIVAFAVRLADHLRQKLHAKNGG